MVRQLFWSLRRSWRLFRINYISTCMLEPPPCIGFLPFNWNFLENSHIPFWVFPLLYVFRASIICFKLLKVFVIYLSLFMEDQTDDSILLVKESIFATWDLKLEIMAPSTSLWASSRYVCMYPHTAPWYCSIRSPLPSIQWDDLVMIFNLSI